VDWLRLYGLEVGGSGSSEHLVATPLSYRKPKSKTGFGFSKSIIGFG